MPLGDSLRYIGLGRQAAVDVQAANVIFLDFNTEFNAKPNVKKFIGDYQTNDRWPTKRVQTQTRFDEVDLKGQVDSTDIGWLLVSAAAPPTLVAHVFTFLFGGTQALPVTGTNSMLLTVVIGEGLNMSWIMINSRVSKITFKYDANNHITYEATLRGIKLTNSALYTPIAYTPPADNSPFMPWESLITLNGTANCIVSANLMIDNQFDPFYCSPMALPAPGAVHGLYPSRFTDGKVKATYDILAQFTSASYAVGQPYYDFDHDLNEAIVIEARDADTTISSGVYPDIKWTIPRAAGTDGSIDRSKPNVLQSVKGEMEFSPGDLTGLKVDLTNALAGYTAS